MLLLHHHSVAPLNDIGVLPRRTPVGDAQERSVDVKPGQGLPLKGNLNLGLTVCPTGPGPGPLALDLVRGAVFTINDLGSCGGCKGSNTHDTHRTRQS